MRPWKLKIIDLISTATRDVTLSIQQHVILRSFFMGTSQVILPSNKRFGLFFSVIFLLGSIYFHVSQHIAYTAMLGTLSLLFFLLSLFRPDALLPLNKLWMQFGLMLGNIVSPIVLGILFFGLITPIAIFLRIFGRDELKLRAHTGMSRWIEPDADAEPQSFKNQF